MSDRDEQLEDLAADLFAAGREETPSPEAKARARAALGLGPPSGGGEGSERGEGRGEGGGESGDPGTGAATAGSPAKLVGGTLVAGAAIVAALLLARGPSAPSAPAEEPATTATPTASATAPAPTEDPVPPPAAETPAASASADPVVPAVSVPDKPVAAPRASGAHAPVASTSAAPSPRGDDLAAELAALDRARTKLRAGDATGALAELDAYAAAHPRGALSTEATLLRVESLVKAGRRAEAERTAAPLLARKAGDMVGDRARRLLAEER